MAPTIGVNLRVTGHCNQGGRKYMEDMFSVAYQQTADQLDLEYAYFGIFDGHGGQEAASFAKEHLMKAIVSQPGFWSDNDEDVLRAIKDGFIATHYAMWRNIEKWPKTASGLPSTSGTTASIAFIRKSNIYIGHVGDSCIVLGYQDEEDKWKGAALTEDHKPETPCEHERIRQAGGQVVCKAGVPRVVWHRPRLVHQGPMTRSTHIDQIPFLAVARSLGDLWSYNADSDRFVVSPEPDVFVHNIELGRDKCLIFGTDGLWNMLTPDEAVSIVKKAEINNKTNTAEGQDQAWLNPSKCLVDRAITKWTSSKLRADNTSAVTLLLDPLGPPNPQVIASQPESKTEFVPYHIETYKVHEGKSPNKPSCETNGLAICTWYPRLPVAAPLDRNNTGMTTLKTMEELFGEKSELEEVEEEGVGGGEEVDQEKTEETREEQDQNDNCTSKSTYASVVKNNNGKEDLQITKDLSLIQIDNMERQEEQQWVKKPRDSIVTVDKKLESTPSMRLRNETGSKNYHMQPANTKQTKKNVRKGKRRKSADNEQVVENEDDNEVMRRAKNKRRHSSLVETIQNNNYEPGVKRRSKSVDYRKHYYDSDTENEKVKLKCKSESICESYERMKLRSNISVKTLRSRNINLEMLDMIFTNSNNKKVNKFVKVTDDDNSMNNNLNNKNSIVVDGKNHSHSRTVYTRSQNKRVKK